jgi:hypothetical protein
VLKSRLVTAVRMQLAFLSAGASSLLRKRQANNSLNFLEYSNIVAICLEVASTFSLLLIGCSCSAPCEQLRHLARSVSAFDPRPARDPSSLVCPPRPARRRRRVCTPVRESSEHRRGIGDSCRSRSRLRMSRSFSYRDNRGGDNGGNWVLALIRHLAASPFLAIARMH